MAGANIETLNRSCFCYSLDDDQLRMALESELGQPGLARLVQERCPYLFSASPVFVTQTHELQMKAVIEAVESTVANPAYREYLLSQAPAIARHDAGVVKGVFLGYDFHLTPAGFGLIEINTNAGGAMLNAVLARAQYACCRMMTDLPQLPALSQHFEDDIVAMFRHEWQLAGHAHELQSIAIVDEAPISQYLYPEFLLFQRLFERHGIKAVISDPASLELRQDRLWHDGLDIDLVYNRLTDFMFDSPASAVLREAWLQVAAVITPNPHTHALYADKRNLALLSDADRLRSFKVPEPTIELLVQGIPKTHIVTPENADRMWAERRRLFFKPFSGYGSRAAYRGDKLTQRVWHEILAGAYVAQVLVAPGERMLATEDRTSALKFDVRNYVYDGHVQWLAARLYQGQTTNFRTPGGGFAPVYVDARA